MSEGTEATEDRKRRGRFASTSRARAPVLVALGLALAAFAPAARAEKFHLLPGDSHKSSYTYEPGREYWFDVGGILKVPKGDTKARRGGPLETITVPPGGSAVTATSFVQGQEYPVVARRSVGTTNADGSYAYDWFYLHECSPFPSQCEPFTGGIPEEYSRIWVSDKTRSNVPLTAFASGGQFAWPAYQEDHVYPLTITDADGPLAIEDAFPSFGYSTAGETGSWTLDVFPPGACPATRAGDGKAGEGCAVSDECEWDAFYKRCGDDPAEPAEVLLAENPQGSSVQVQLFTADGQRPKARGDHLYTAFFKNAPWGLGSGESEPGRVRFSLARVGPDGEATGKLEVNIIASPPMVCGTTCVGKAWSDVEGEELRERMEATGGGKFLIESPPIDPEQREAGVEITTADPPVGEIAVVLSPAGRCVRAFVEKAKQFRRKMNTNGKAHLDDDYPLALIDLAACLEAAKQADKAGKKRGGSKLGLRGSRSGCRPLVASLKARLKGNSTVSYSGKPLSGQAAKKRLRVSCRAERNSVTVTVRARRGSLRKVVGKRLEVGLYRSRAAKGTVTLGVSFTRP